MTSIEQRDVQSVLAGIDDLLPLIAKRAQATEELRRLPDETAMIGEAYESAFGRSPCEAEVKLARRFLHDQTAAEPTQRRVEYRPASGESPIAFAAVVDFCHALFNCNEFIYID